MARSNGADMVGMPGYASKAEIQRQESGLGKRVCRFCPRFALVRRIHSQVVSWISGADEVKGMRQYLFNVAARDEYKTKPRASSVLEVAFASGPELLIIMVGYNDRQEVKFVHVTDGRSNQFRGNSSPSKVGTSSVPPSDKKSA